MNGIPWPVTIYYDPPQSSRGSIYHCPLTGNALTFQFPCRLSHAPATLLVDTGCAGAHYISASFCRRIGLIYQSPVTRVDPTKFSGPALQSVTLPDGQSLDALGTVRVPLQCQGYKESLVFTVLDLDTECDVIVGDPWLRRHRAILDFSSQSLTFPFKGSRLTLAPPPVRAAAGTSRASPPRL